MPNEDELKNKTAFISDMDGVIYHGNNLLPGAADFIRLMEERQLRYLFLTNSSERTPRELAEKLTKGRVQLGPGTLYTILSRFLDSGYLREVAVEGRKRTYALTEEGRLAYGSELGRLRQCLRDAETAAAFLPAEGGDPDADKKPALPPAPLPAL